MPETTSLSSFIRPTPSDTLDDRLRASVIAYNEELQQSTITLPSTLAPAGVKAPIVIPEYQARERDMMQPLPILHTPKPTVIFDLDPLESRFLPNSSNSPRSFRPSRHSRRQRVKSPRPLFTTVPLNIALERKSRVVHPVRSVYPVKEAGYIYCYKIEGPTTYQNAGLYKVGRTNDYLRRALEWRLQCPSYRHRWFSPIWAEDTHTVGKSCFSIRQDHTH